MSFATCSTRFESRPARTRDAGAQVDSARTVTSSPELAWSTGSPAASRSSLHAGTVFGVGALEPATGRERVPANRGRAVVDGRRRRPARRTTRRNPASPLHSPAAGQLLDARHSPPPPSASTFTPFSLFRSVLTLIPNSSDARGCRGDTLQRSLDQLCLGFAHIERRQDHRALGHRHRGRPGSVGIRTSADAEEVAADPRRRRTAPGTTQSESLTVEGVFSASIASPLRITARSTACCSSRTLPGQS